MAMKGLHLHGKRASATLELLQRKIYESNEVVGVAIMYTSLSHTIEADSPSSTTGFMHRHQHFTHAVQISII